MITRVTVQEAAKAVKSTNSILIDVREPDEIAVVAAEGAIAFPMSKIDPTVFTTESGIAKTTPLYLLCKSGGRSMRVATALEAQGYQNLFNVEGGIIAWAEADLPTLRGG